MNFTAWIVAVFGLLCAQGYAQTEAENIVPNPGFESYSSMPLGWFYTGRDFTRVIKFWESPTAASPDVYGPKVYVPSQWKEQGFGDISAASGRSWVGLTLFGCEEGKPHCREYLQIQLKEPLVVGQRYEVSLATAHLPLSTCTRNVEVAFTPERVYESLDARLELESAFTPDHVVMCKPGQWETLKGEFYAFDQSAYILIGNFHDDASTEIRRSENGESLPFAYYYFDDIVVRKLPPIIEAFEPVDLSSIELVEGTTVQLHNIYFDHDRADFLPRSYIELDALTSLMHDNPEMVIEIHGHTDNIGTADYNQDLSLERAQAVMDYLIDHDIKRERLSARGYGSEVPLAENGDEVGRQQNRRVEFLVVSKS